MKLFLVISFFLLGLIIPEKKEGAFENDQIYVAAPSGWRIKPSVYIENEYFLISITKKGLDQSGQVLISGHKGKSDLEKVLTDAKELYSSSAFFKTTNSGYLPSSKITFNGYPALASPFKYVLLGMEYRGYLIALHSEACDITIRCEGAVEDLEQNSIGFKAIESTFKIK